MSTMFPFRSPDFKPTIVPGVGPTIGTVSHTTAPLPPPPPPVPTPTFTTRLPLPREFCTMKPTPDDFRTKAPFAYDIAEPKNQPIGLMALKSAFNTQFERKHDGTEGYVHIAEPLLENASLKQLQTAIEGYCEPKK